MKLFLCGQKFFGAQVLALCLRGGHKVVGVSSPAMASGGSQLDQLRAAAEIAGVPWREAGDLDADWMPAGLDLILCAQSHDFISAAVRKTARLGAIGYHPSLLPLHRGRDAIRWAVRMRERVTGGTIYWMDDVVDGGDVAAQEHVFIRPGDTAEDLWRRELCPLGLRLFGHALSEIEAGRLPRESQRHELATWEPSLAAERLSRA